MRHLIVILAVMGLMAAPLPVEAAQHSPAGSETLNGTIGGAILGGVLGAGVGALVKHNGKRRIGENSASKASFHIGLPCLVRPSAPRRGLSIRTGRLP